LSGAGPIAPSRDAIARHPHLAEPLPVGHVRVDCHLHTMWSGDCTTTPDEMRDAVAATRLDVVCITDHATVTGARILAAEGVLGCRTVIGQEQRLPGELIGLVLEDRIPPGLRSARECALAIKERAGLVYVPHPFDPLRHHIAARSLDELVAEGLVDLIETRNGKTSLEHLNSAAAEFAARHRLAAGAGSDAHVPDAVGAAYVEMADFTDGDAASFLRAVTSARVVGHHYDPARAWRSRVVPSTSRGRL
jgi:predicted metal-dependent phosphoesterase TrpH